MVHGSRLGTHLARPRSACPGTSAVRRRPTTRSPAPRIVSRSRLLRRAAGSARRIPPGRKRSRKTVKDQDRHMDSRRRGPRRRSRPRDRVRPRCRDRPAAWSSRTPPRRQRRRTQGGAVCCSCASTLHDTCQRLDEVQVAFGRRRRSTATTATSATSATSRRRDVAVVVPWKSISGAGRWRSAHATMAVDSPSAHRRRARARAPARRVAMSCRTRRPLSSSQAGPHGARRGRQGRTSSTTASATPALRPCRSRDRRRSRRASSCTACPERAIQASARAAGVKARVVMPLLGPRSARLA